MHICLTDIIQWNSNYAFAVFVSFNPNALDRNAGALLSLRWIVKIFSRTRFLKNSSKETDGSVSVIPRMNRI